MRRALAIAAGFAAAIVVACHAAHWIGWWLTDEPPAGGTCAVLVPGFPARDDGTPHFIQRLRVAAGVAVFRARGCERLVLSGGAVSNRYVEADVMAGVARELGIAASAIAREPKAADTWENVALAAPLLAGFDRVFVASDSLHAHRAVRYACKQQPDRCASTFAFSLPARLRDVPWHVPSAFHELRARIRDALVYGARTPLPSSG